LQEEEVNGPGDSRGWWGGGKQKKIGAGPSRPRWSADGMETYVIIKGGGKKGRDQAGGYGWPWEGTVLQGGLGVGEKELVDEMPPTLKTLVGEKKKNLKKGTPAKDRHKCRNLGWRLCHRKLVYIGQKTEGGIHLRELSKFFGAITGEMRTLEVKNGGRVLCGGKNRKYIRQSRVKWKVEKTLGKP